MPGTLRLTWQACVVYIIISMIYIFGVFEALSTTTPDSDGKFTNIKGQDTGYVFLYQIMTNINYFAVIIGVFAFAADMYFMFNSNNKALKKGKGV